MAYAVTVTTSKNQVRDLEEIECTVEELTASFSEFDTGPKDGEAIIPATFKPCTVPCRQHELAKRVDCGGGAMHRLSANVAAMTMLGADLDDVPREMLLEKVERLIARGIMFWIWETYSHDPTAATVRARILIPLKTPLPLKNPRQWSQVAWAALLAHVGLDGVAGADPACKDPARVYYTPRKPTAQDVREADYSPGEPLDWVPVLGDSLDALAVTPEPRDVEPPDDDAPVDLDDVRERLKQLKPGPTKKLINNVLAGRAPVAPPGERKAGEPSRYLAWRTVSSVLATKADDRESTQALLEILRPAWQCEVRDDPNGHTDWETIENLFETARDGMPAYRAQVEAERRTAEEIFTRAMARTATARREVEAPPTPADATTEALTPTEGMEWIRACSKKATKEGFEIVNTPANVEAVLRLHPDWRGVLRYNDVTKNVEVWGGPIGRKDGKPRLCADDDAANVADWLERTEEVGLRLGDAVAWSRMVSVAKKSSYDPLKDYLTGIQWDGRKRLGTLLVDYFGAHTKDANGNDITEYLTTVGTKWLVSAVARALRPGCKADVMLELEGGQGKGKSTALEILGGEFYTDAQIDFSSKDSLAIISQSWIVELGELDALRKSDVTAQKAFISKKFDDFRPPYGRVTARFLRRCVFVGTTNTMDYLHDETGHRRHLPVACEQVNVEALRRDRDQIWGEAVALLNSGTEWWLTEQEQARADTQTEQRMGSDAIAETVETWMLQKEPAARPAYLTTAEVCEILQTDTTRGNEMRIAKAMRRLGFSRTRVPPLRTRGFLAPAELLTADRRGATSIVKRMADARGMSVLPGGSNGEDDRGAGSAAAVGGAGQGGGGVE